MIHNLHLVEMKKIREIQKMVIRPKTYKYQNTAKKSVTGERDVLRNSSKKSTEILEQFTG